MRGWEGRVCFTLFHLVCKFPWQICLARALACVWVLLVLLLVLGGFVVGFFLTGKFDLNHMLIPVVDRPCLALVRQCREKKKLHDPNHWVKSPLSLGCGAPSWNFLFALATRNVTTPLTVEYLTPANDASGRLYATQICAQRLPRELRLLIYGSTHKEVDLTGAHYELIRAMTGSVTLPPTHLLRGRLKETWAGDQVADPEPSLDEVKMLPIRVINSGAARALKHVTDKGLGIPPWIEAFAFDLEAARDIFTAHVRREVRPRVDALAKNRHFFAAEAIEAIFMQLFLLEVRKRTDTPSINWLHDGLWIGREVDDQILYAAESHVRRLLFPHANSASSLFSIVDLHEAWQSAVSTCPPLTPRCLPDAIKGPNEVGDGGRLLGNFQLPNSVIDKRLSVSSPATLTGLASVPA